MDLAKITVNGDYLELHWSDQPIQKISLINLRRNCPCAICLKQKEEDDGRHFKMYRQDEITIANINVVGQYALSISWKDGHNTGIYEFSLLKKLAEEE